MENIKITATDRSPEVDFDFEKGVFTLRGESYPEDVPKFFGPLIDDLNAYLSSDNLPSVEMNFELIYFNSSTAKVLMSLFDLFDQTAARGVPITVNWRYDSEDETMQELGEELAEDLEHASFNLIALEE
ncbi:MAG: Fe-S oxidoreductase [Rhodospirillaceae bacterium]|nr:Fe-S oxidoreductase [Rhodospirillaceae bacterium]